MKDDKKLKGLDQSIDSLLYDIDKKDLKKRDNIEEIRDKVSEISTGYNSITKSPDVLEFLTQTVLNDNSSKILKSGAKDSKLKKKTTDSINKLIEQNNISAFLTEEKDRIERYNDYRIIDAYIPQVSRCMDLYRDSIMSPDDISKKSINLDYTDTNTTKEELNKIEDNIKDLITKFRIDKKTKQWIRNALVTGDCFVATLKIDDEINRMMLKEEHDMSSVLPKTEMNVLTEHQIFDFNPDELKLLETVFFNEEMTEKTKEKVKANINTKFNDMKKDIVNRINDNIIYVDDATRDLDTIKNQGDIEKDFKEVKFNGAVLKELEPERTIKLTIDDFCLGYLYIEKYDATSESGTEGFGISSSQMIDGCACGTTDYFNSRYDINTKGDTTLKNKLLTDIFVKGISKKLDKKVIEKNQQFKEVIYQLIKKDYLLDKKIKIVFYSPEQVEHYAMDSDETYGMSKLAKILFFAKIFLATMLTETMQKISRGRDKRVVYVETGIDEDIEGSIQSVVRDIKTKEIQADDLKTITSIFKQVGAFEDYFIPKIDGEVPIDIETISGMDVNVDDDFLQYLLKSIISGIGIPATYTDASNEVDFSRSLVMQNSTFVREIVSKQGDAQEFITNICRKLYMYEYGIEGDKNFDINKLEVTFPTPEFLNVSNINEQIGNHTSTIEFITNTYFDPNSQEPADMKLQHEFKKELTKDLVTTIDWDRYDGILEKCMKNINKQELEQQEIDEPDDDMGGDDLGGDDMGF